MKRGEARCFAPGAAAACQWQLQQWQAQQRMARARPPATCCVWPSSSSSIWVNSAVWSDVTNSVGNTVPFDSLLVAVLDAFMKIILKVSK